MGNQQERLDRTSWIAVPEFSGYFVNEEGDVLSTRRRTEGRLLTQSKHYGRGKKAYLRLKAGGILWLSHRFIIAAFIGRHLKPDEQVNHLDADTRNNARSNLEVVSQRENVNHAVQAKLYCSGSEWYKARGIQEC